MNELKGHRGDTTVCSASGDREEFLFFRNGPHSLFGAHFQPRVEPTGLGVVLCHPFGEEKIYSHRLLTNFARFLAGEGISAFRFDFMGQGDSTGEFVDATVTTRLSDIDCALDWLAAQPHVTRLALVGLRLGSAWAALVASRRTDVGYLAMWDPVVDVGAHLYEELRAALAVQTVLFRSIVMNRDSIVEQLLTSGKVEHEGIPLNQIQGWELSKRFYEEAAGVDLRKEMSGFQGACLLMPIAKKEKPLTALVQQLNDVLVERGADVSIEKAVEEFKFWQINPHEFCTQPSMLFDRTFAWFKGVGA